MTPLKPLPAITMNISPAINSRTLLTNRFSPLGRFSLTIAITSIAIAADWNLPLRLHIRNEQRANGKANARSRIPRPSVWAMKSPKKNMNDDSPMVMDMMATKVLPLLRHMTDSIRTKHERTALDSSYIPQSP